MIRVAYLGPEQTNTHLAAIKRFGRRARYVHAPTVDDVFIEVERQRADYGVVPVENSLEGAVTHTLDRFIDFKHSPVKIHGEVEQLIHHALILRAGTALEEVGTVFSHPQALAQCRQWLERHLPRAHRWETSSTAAAMEYLNKRQPGLGPSARRAVIGRPELVRAGLRAIPIPDDRENKTRFLILGLGEAPKGRRNKTSIMFALKDKPGALHDSLVPFKGSRINLTKIESRPSKRRAWEYLFFIDFEGHATEPRVQRALTSLQRHTADFQLLGSYPSIRP